MPNQLTDARREAFATRALTEPVAQIAKEAGVQPSTVYDWMKKFSVSVPAGTTTSGSLSHASLVREGAADGDANYEGVKGALPPDQSRVSYWRAENWKVSQSHSKHPIVDIVGFPDGRHGLVMPHASSNPRRAIHEEEAGLGTFAGVGRSPYGDNAVWSFADTPHPSDKEAGRVTWWRAAHTVVEQEWQLRWMVAALRGDDFGAMSTEERDRDPSVNDLWDAARAYHETTGDFALPVFHSSSTTGQFQLGDPENPSETSGCPVGFAILSAQQAKGLRNDTTWQQAYKDLSEPMAVFNDWRDGLPVEATVMVFSDDPNEDPVDVPTGYYPTKHLAEASRSFLEETGAGHFA